MRHHGLLVAGKALLSVILLLMGIVIALGAGELVVRLVAPQQLILFRPDIWRPVDSLGWAQREDLLTEVNTGDRTVTLVTDSSGFRISPAGRPAGRYHILLLGDSFMQALQVEYDESFAGLIERCFGSRTGQTAAVWNTGVGGWDPPQYYLQARSALNSTPFDLVVVAVFLGNDVVTRRQLFRPREPDPLRVLRMPRHLTWHEFIDAVLAPINDGLETRSHLFIFLKNRFQGVLMQAGLTALEIPTELRRDEAGTPRWRVTGDILADIDSLAKAQDIPTLFVLIPSIEQVDPAAMQVRLKAFRVDPASLDLDQPDRLLGAELSRHGLRYVSLLAPFRAAQARGMSLYGRVDPHLSAEGHRLLWSLLGPTMAQALSLTYDSTLAQGLPCGTP